MLNTVLKSIKAGHALSGRYKRGGRTSMDVAIIVDRTFSVPDGFGGETIYVVGAYSGASPRAGTVTALRADCFDPRTLLVTEVKDYRPLPTEGTQWFLTTGSGAFGFTERVADDDVEWAEAHGGIPLADYEKEFVPVAVMAG